MIDSKIRIREIADAAGVSLATVSRVINRNPVVKENTRAAVCRAMQELGIKLPKGIDQPSPLNTSRASQESNILLVLIPSRNEIFHQDIIRGIGDSAKAHNYHVVTYIGAPTENTLSEFIVMVQTMRVRGIISTIYIDKEVLQKLAKEIPVVQCCEYSDSSCSYVSVDDRTAARTATEYILSTGHRKIALLNSSLRFRFSRHRHEGFMTAMESAGITVPDNWIVNLANSEFDTAAAAVMQLLSGASIPDAIFATSDYLALAVLSVAHNMGVDIPGDLVVVGFDDISIASMSTPMLTTVNMPTYQMGYTSSEILMDKIHQENNIDKHILFNPKLVIRASSAKENVDRIVVRSLTPKSSTEQ